MTGSFTYVTSEWFDVVVRLRLVQLYKTGVEPLSHPH